MSVGYDAFTFGDARCNDDEIAGCRSNLDRARFGPQARDALWDAGLRIVLQELREGYQYGALADLVRLVGIVTGVLGSVVRRQ